MVTKLEQTVDAQAPTDEAEEQQRRLQIEENQALIALLRSWRETTDPDELQDQKETWGFLERALDEDRLSYRKFFS